MRALELAKDNWALVRLGAPLGSRIEGGAALLVLGAAGRATRANLAQSAGSGCAPALSFEKGLAQRKATLGAEYVEA